MYIYFCPPDGFESRAFSVFFFFASSSVSIHSQKFFCLFLTLFTAYSALLPCYCHRPRVLDNNRSLQCFGLTKATYFSATMFSFDHS